MEAVTAVRKQFFNRAVAAERARAAEPGADDLHDKGPGKEGERAMVPRSYLSRQAKGLSRQGT